MDGGVGGGQVREGVEVGVEELGLGLISLFIYGLRLRNVFLRINQNSR